MFNGMGIQWASTLLGCVAVVLVPIPVVFYLYGGKIRQKSAFAPTAPPRAPAAPVAESASEEEKEAAAARSTVPATTTDKEAV